MAEAAVDDGPPPGFIPEDSLAPKASANGAPAGLIPEADIDATQPAPVTLKGIGKQILTGAEEVPYRLAGAPVDLANFGERAGVGAINKMFGTKTEPKQFPGGYEDLTKWAGKVHPALDPNTMPAQNLPERMARSAGAAMGAVGAAPLAAEAIPGGLGAAARSMAGSPSVGALPAAAASGAGSQYGGEYGSTIWDPKEHPYLSSAAGTAGALIGGGAAGLATRAPAAVLASSPERQSIIDAGQRIGAPPPRYMVGSPSIQATGELAHSIPLVGTPIDKANHAFVGNLGEAADKTGWGLGSGEVVPAGQAVQSGIKNWIGPVSKDNVSKAYQQVDSLIKDPTKTVPLANTQKAMEPIIARRAEYGDTPGGQAIDLVQKAINEGTPTYFDRAGGQPYYQPHPGIDYTNQPGSMPYVQNVPGLTYQGMKDLRTRVGQLLDTQSILPSSVPDAERKQLYGALSDDTKAAVTAAGGPEAAQAYQQANVLARATAIRRQQLSKLLGSTDPNSDKPEAVFANMQRAAGSTGAANVGLLAKAKSAVSPQDWDELTSGMVGQLGRNNQGEFSPNSFLTDYGKISDDAKDLLFGGAGAQTRQNLDDLAQLSGTAKSVHGKYGNASGTGHVVAAMEFLRQAVDTVKESGGVMKGAVNLGGMAGTLGGGRVIAGMLAQPAGSGAIANFAKSYSRYVSAPSPQTLQQMKFASQRVSGTMAAQYGTRVNPDMITRAAMGAQPAAADQGQVAPAPGQQQPDQSKQDQ